jgi:hypothetical protein
MTKWKEFDFYTDEKKTIWYRVHFTVRAETEEEAHHLAKKMFDKDDYAGEDGAYGDYEQLTDTVENMSVEENGMATRELYVYPEGNMIKDNLNLKD